MVKQTFQSRLRTLFSIDLRSLALYRITLGSLLIFDLINRASALKAHYSDVGVLPRDVFIDRFMNEWHLSFHLLTGRAELQAVLFIIAGLFALAMILGYRTRLATVVSWIFLISLQSRNPMVLQGGDVLFRMLVFWGMFLPLGVCYSIDSALNNRTEQKPAAVITPATIAVLMQVCLVYWITAILKNHPIWYQEGTAVYYALNIDQFVTPLGHYLLNFPGLLKAITFATIVLEAVGPFLAFIPWCFGPLRTLCAFLFIGLHLSFVSTLEIGLFPYISVAGWLVFLPTWFWDKLFKRFKTVKRLGLRIYYDGDCGFCKKTVYIVRTFFLFPEVSIQPTEVDPSIHQDMLTHNSWVVMDAEARRHYGFEALVFVMSLTPVIGPLFLILRWKPLLALGEAFYATVAQRRQFFSALLAPLSFRPLKWETSRFVATLALLSFIYVALWNVRSLDFDRFKKYFPRKLNGIAYVLRLDQFWNMFSPYPLKDDGWFVIVGTTFAGDEVDLFQGRDEISWDKPESVVNTYPNQRWRKYMMNLWKKKYSKHRPYYSKYLCREYNKTHTKRDRIKSIEVFFMRENTVLDPKLIKAKKVALGTYACFGEGKSKPKRQPSRIEDWRERLKKMKKEREKLMPQPHIDRSQVDG